MGGEVCLNEIFIINGDENYKTLNNIIDCFHRTYRNEIIFSYRKFLLKIT